MATEMAKAAMSGKLKEMDWEKKIKICELVEQDPGLEGIQDLSLYMDLLTKKGCKLDEFLTLIDSVGMQVQEKIQFLI
ncbi:hypothetical protein Zm00014a_023236 [Zea mays]|uniref:Uncharacterized protein n=1 Tax=Zea mays TaxID=4577 RepID=A0A3L6ETM0_MAIZE|nr:hypothetical protein Zm00014a_023236 [Zea mays]